jgi:MFS family permease
MALLFVTIVAGLASTVFVPLAQWLVDQHGWRATLRVLAAVLGTITIPLHAYVLRGIPGTSAGSATAGADPPVSPAEVSRPALVLCAVAFALAQVAGTALAVYLLPVLVEDGFDTSFAAAAVSLTGIAQIFGRPLFTWLRPRYSLGFWSAVLFLPFAGGVGALALEPSRGVVLASVVVMSMVSGSLTLARATWTLELFPVASFARVNGVLGLWSMIGRASAPLAMGAARDVFGSHRPGLVGLALVCVAGALSAWLAARITRHRGEERAEP